MNAAQLIDRLSALTPAQLRQLDVLTTYTLALRRCGLPDGAIDARLGAFLTSPALIPASPAAARRAARRFVVSYMARGAEYVQ